MKMNKKFLAIILAASMAVSAAPMALADEVTDELLDAIVNAEDASFEAAAEAIIENEDTDYEPYSSFELFALKSDGTTFTPAEGYDVVVNDNTFDTETDGYKVSDGSYQAWKNVTFSGNYYASIDFMYTDAAQIMEIRNKTSGGDLGPAFLYNTTDGLANRLNNSGGTAALYKSFALNKWYKLVINGRMKVTGALTYFSLYERGESGTYTQVVAPTSIYLRNFQPGSTKANPFLLVSNGVYIDNEYAVQQWPSVIEISAPDNAASIDAGKSIQFSATAKINGTDANVTQPTVVWSLTGVSSENTEYITIDADTGKFTVDARAKSQSDKVTVVAEAQSNGKPSASYEIAVNVQDLSSEPFDAVTVSGASEIAAGGSAETYTFTAEKDGSAVTPAAGTYKWKILDSTGSRVLGNKFITITDEGVLTVTKQALPQTVKIRLESSSGVVGTEKTVNITNKTTSYGESYLHTDAFEVECSNTLSAHMVATDSDRSWDGSAYYVATKTNDYGDSDFIGKGSLGTGSSSGDIMMCVDMRFPKDGTGFKTVRNDGSRGLWVTRNGGSIKIQKGNSNYADNMSYSVSDDKWYHIELMFNCRNGSREASALTIGEYDSNGNITNKQTFTKLYSRGADNSGTAYPFNRIFVNDGTHIDNYTTFYPNPTEMKITDSEGTELSTAVTVNAGIATTFGVTGSRDGLNMSSLAASDVDWAVYEKDNDIQVAGNDFSITSGVLSSNGLTTPQQLRVRASKGNAIAYVPISVVAANQFEITGLGYDGGDEKDTNEGKQRTVNKKHLVRLYVNKLGDYKDDVVFIMTLFDGNGKLAGSYSKKTSGKSLQTGEDNEVAIDYNLPAEFDETSWTAKIMAWTSLTTNKEPEELESTFSVSYNNGTVTLSNLPALTGKRTVAIYNPGTTDSQLAGDTSERIAYIAQSETEITSIRDLNLVQGTYTVAIGGSMSDGSYGVHRATFTVSTQ